MQPQHPRSCSKGISGIDFICGSMRAMDSRPLWVPSQQQEPFVKPQRQTTSHFLGRRPPLGRSVWSALDAHPRIRSGPRRGSSNK